MTVFPNTTPVEVDLSVIGWEKNDYQQKSNGLLPQRNHTCETIQMSARIGLIIGPWPPYNTTIPMLTAHSYGIPIFSI